MPKAALRKAATSANAGGDEAEQRNSGGEADDADDREHEPDELGELQRGHRLLLGDRSEAGSHQGAEDQAVGMLPRPAPRADREHHGLHTEDHGSACSG